MHSSVPEEQFINKKSVEPCFICMEAPVSPGTDKNNTPHPYEELCAVSCLHASMLHGTLQACSYLVMSACCPRSNENLPDFHTRRKRTLSTICLSGAEMGLPLTIQI